MNWIDSLFCTPSAMQTIVVISLVCAAGLALGKIRFLGVSLGIACVFFVGIIGGHIGLAIDPRMLEYAENFGLVLFVYCLGLSVGPGFFGSLAHKGLALNAWSMAVILTGTVMAIALCPLTGISLPDMAGILCGATTNTPALGAAQQTLAQLGVARNGAALSCAVTYPLGVVGVILAILVLRKLFVKAKDLAVRVEEDDKDTYIARFNVVNPALEGKTLAEITSMIHFRFIISRIWRGKEVIVPRSVTKLQMGDRLMVVMTKDELSALDILFGERIKKEDWNSEEVDWNAIDSKVGSRIIVMTYPGLNGKSLGSLHLRQTYNVNVSRITRGDIKLLATPDLRLQYGDRLHVVGDPQSLDAVQAFFGNSALSLEEPNLAAIFIGIILGLALGSIPVSFPGMSVPVKLGVAGGPIIVGILVGAFGPRFGLITYTTRSASLMLRKLGLSFFLACLGLASGVQFFETVFRPEGLMWVGVGFLLTVLPVVIVGLIALRTGKMDYGTICGILCGAMANPMALAYANDTIEGDTPSVSYATVYPLGMFARVIIVQVMLMFLL
ncbi:MAG: putative transporter [Prevotellaceae bacterium]|nr:putative transporter [Prevotella sp.]MDD7257921.1 putative transporter [Prevotellaceae bacterium]MDY6129681.1 putative transporter [Prevotella sp.]